MASSEPILIGTGVGPLNPISITLVSSGMAGSGLSPADTGIYSFPSQVGIGVAGNVNAALTIAPGASASLIRHTTLLTFNVSAIGFLTSTGMLANVAADAAGIFIRATSAGDQLYMVARAAGNGTQINSRNAADNAYEPLLIGSSGLTSNGLITASAGVTVAAGQVLKLGNARSAGIVAQGGTVTMQDSTGATVQVLVA